jgi:TonB family protein
MAQYYPKAAAAAHVEGRAVLRCTVAATGDLIDCTTAAEEPAGQGFGDAALHLAPLFKMRPMTKDGTPVSGGKINIPIRFVAPKQAIPTLEVALECYGAAAALAEQDPAAQPAQAETFAWRLVVEALSLPEKLRPSQLEDRLSSARKMGGTPAGGEASHPQCLQILSPESVQGLFSAMKLPPGFMP